MSNRKRLPVQSVSGMTGVAIALSILIFGMGELCIPQYRSLFGEFFSQYPPATQLTFDTYRLVLLGVPTSVLIWVLFRYRFVEEPWALALLNGAIAALLIYAMVGTVTLILPFVALFSRVG